MKFSVIVLSCVLAVASAQVNNGQYIPEKQNTNKYNQYNKYDQYKPYNRYQNNGFKPLGSSTPTPVPSFFVSSTPTPVPSFFVSSTPIPSTIAPARSTFTYVAPTKIPEPEVYRPEISLPVVPSRSSLPAPSASPVTYEEPLPIKKEVTYISPAPVAPVVPVAPVAKTISVVPVPKYYGDAHAAETLKFNNQINEDGAFEYSYETSNGIVVQEHGVPRSFYSGEAKVSPVVAEGSYRYFSPEGQETSMTYVADENGYFPTGAVISPQLARALEYIARNIPVKSAQPN